MRDVVTEMSELFAWVRIQHGFPFEDREIEIDRQYHRAPALYRVESEDRGRPVRTRIAGEGLPSRSTVPLHERTERRIRARADHHRRRAKPRIQRQRRRARILKRVRWVAFKARPVEPDGDPYALSAPSAAKRVAAWLRSPA